MTEPIDIGKGLAVTSRRIFTMDDIRRFPSQSHIYFLECSGNPGYKKPYGKTASDLVGLLSCAEWTGLSLKLVLQEAGLQAGAKWVIAEGADAAAMTRSIPVEKCLEDAMLVYSRANPIAASLCVASRR